MVSPHSEQLKTSPDADLGMTQAVATGLPALLKPAHATRTRNSLAAHNELPELIPALRNQVGQAAVQKGTATCQAKQPCGVNARKRPQVPALIWAFLMWQTSAEWDVLALKLCQGTRVSHYREACFSLLELQQESNSVAPFFQKTKNY